MRTNPKNIEVPGPDNRLLHIHTGFTPESWERFLGRKPALEEGIFTFPLSKGFREETTVEERLGIDGKRWIPRNTFYALTFDPSLSKDVYIFQSVTDAHAYFLVHKFKRQVPTFLVLGKNPSVSAIGYVRDTYPGYRFILGFCRDHLSIATEIKIAGLLRNKLVSVRLDRGVYHLQCGDKSARIPADHLSLSNFYKATGLRWKIRTVKPPLGFNCYYDVLQASSRPEPGTFQSHKI